MILAWGVSTLLWAMWPEGIDEGRTICCQSAVSEQCLRNPNLNFGSLSVRIVAKFRCIESIATCVRHFERN